MRKAKKFYALHLFTFLWAMVFTARVLFRGEADLTETLLGLPLNLLLLHSCFNFSAMSGNPVTWFLSTLMACYFFFPLLGGRIYNRRLGVLFMLAAAVACARLCVELAALRWESEAFFLFVYVNPLVRVWDFFLGMIAGCVYVREKADAVSHTSALQMGALLLYGGAVCAGGNALYDGGYFPVFFVVLSAAVIYSLALDGAVSRLFSARPLVYLGNLSMEGYFLHVLVIWSVGAALSKCGLHLGMIGNGVLAFCVTVGLAQLLRQRRQVGIRQH